MKIDLVSDEAKQVAGYWSALIQEGVVAVDPSFSDTWFQGLANGKYASWLTAAWGPVFLQGTAAKSSGLWRVAQLPQWPDATSPASANWGGSSNAVLATTANPIAAAELARWITHEKVPAMQLATEQALFPTLTAALEDPAFVGATSEFFGGQEVNKMFSEISTTVEADFGWLPFMEYAHSAGNETMGKAIADKTDLLVALQAWQDDLVAYAKQQNFTVVEE